MQQPHVSFHCADELWRIDNCKVVDNFCYAINTSNFESVPILKHAKPPAESVLHIKYWRT